MKKQNSLTLEWTYRLKNFCIFIGLPCSFQNQLVTDSLDRDKRYRRRWFCFDFLPDMPDMGH